MQLEREYSKERTQCNQWEKMDPNGSESNEYASGITSNCAAHGNEDDWRR